VGFALAFQLKSFVAISASMLNYVRGVTTKITDLIPGSTARTLIEAPANELEQFYIQVFNGLKEAIPTAVFKTFKFTQLAAAYATDVVTITAPVALLAAIPIADQTPFTSADGRVYYSTEALTWAAGTTSIAFPVIAAASGSAYNIAAGAINSSTSFDDGTYTISNAGTTSGRDTETDSERLTRFSDYIAALSRGTDDALLYGIGTATLADSTGDITEYVTRSGIDSSLAGFVKLYIYGSSGAPSGALVSTAQTIIDGWINPDGSRTPGYRAGGVGATVAAMAQVPISLTIQVSMLDGYTVGTSTQTSVTSAFATLLSGIDTGDILYADAIETAVLGVAGIESVVINVTENTTCGQNQVLVPGTVTVSQLS